MFCYLAQPTWEPAPLLTFSPFSFICKSPFALIISAASPSTAASITLNAAQTCSLQLHCCCWLLPRVSVQLKLDLTSSDLLLQIYKPFLLSFHRCVLCYWAHPARLSAHQTSRAFNHHLYSIWSFYHWQQLLGNSLDPTTCRKSSRMDQQNWLWWVHTC